jgi:hypothetical protein
MDDYVEDRIICGFEGYEISMCLYLSSVSLFWYYRVMTVFVVVAVVEILH